MKKSDSEKLNDIFEMLTEVMEDIEEACDNDYEYTSWGGNGVNCSEAALTFRPIYEEAVRIMGE